MKYTIDVECLPGFIQCMTQPESGDGHARPYIMQFRGAASCLTRMQEALTATRLALAGQELRYHDDADARAAFDYGASFFRPGDIPVTVVLQRRHVQVFVGGQVAFQEVADLIALQNAVARALSQLA